MFRGIGERVTWHAVPDHKKNETKRNRKTKIKTMRRRTIVDDDADDSDDDNDYKTTLLITR